MCRCPQSSEEDVRFPGTGVIGGVNCLKWVLGAEPRSSVTAASAPNHWATSVAPVLVFFL